MDESLDSLVRRVDEDRWLASRFAPADVQQRLIALYAVNYEIARTAETVREPGLGLIRLQWWNDAIAELFEGGQPRAHPALIALKSVIAEAPLSRKRFETMIAARRLDFETAPLTIWPAFSDYISRTTGALMRLAIEACGQPVESGPIEGFAQSGAWRWGVTGILRSEPHWRAQGRQLWPPYKPRGQTMMLARRRQHSHPSHKTPAAIFPASGYVALVPASLRSRGRVRAHAPLLERQLRLIAASATGRF